MLIEAGTPSIPTCSSCYNTEEGTTGDGRPHSIKATALYLRGVWRSLFFLCLRSKTSSSSSVTIVTASTISTISKYTSTISIPSFREERPPPSQVIHIIVFGKKTFSYPDIEKRDRFFDLFYRFLIVMKLYLLVMSPPKYLLDSSARRPESRRLCSASLTAVQSSVSPFMTG